MTLFIISIRHSSTIIIILYCSHNLTLVYNTIWWTLTSRKLNIKMQSSYVAFSHVWAHRLGNLAENGLPLCQVKRLQSLASNLYNSERPNHEPRRVHESKDIAMWIGTLCIPIPVGKLYKNARKQAILKLADIYGQADRVLVLDAELQNISPTIMSPLEMEMRMLICSWIRRLWTLQEALLSGFGRLYF